MEFRGGKKHFPENHGAKTREQEIADRGFQREEGGAFVVEPRDDLHGKGTHMDKPLVTDISDPKRDEPLQTGGQFSDDRVNEIAHRGFDRKAGGAFQNEPKDDLHGKGTHMDKPLVTNPSDSKRDEPLQDPSYGKDREEAIAERGFTRKAGGAFKEEPRGDLKGAGTHLDKPLVNDKDTREEPIQTGAEFIGDRDSEIAHRGFDRKAGGAFKDEPQDDLKGKGTHMDKPLVTDIQGSKRDEPQQGGTFEKDREGAIADRGFDRKAGGAFKEEPRGDLKGAGTHMDKPLVTGAEERKEGLAPQKELPTKASKHTEDNPGDKIRERFERTAGKAESAEMGQQPLVYGYGNQVDDKLHKEDLIKASPDNKEKINPGQKIQERFDRTVEKVEEARLEGSKDMKEFVTKASKHTEIKINPGEKIRARFERTMEKAEAAEEWIEKPVRIGGFGDLPEEPLHKEDLIKISHDVKEEINPGEKIRDRFERTMEKIEEVRLEEKKDQLKEFITKASKHAEENPGDKIRERFERTLDKVGETEKAKLAEKFLIEKQNMDADLKEEEIQHYLDKREQRL